MKTIKDTLEDLPQTPGVYIYYNEQKEVIYVGKAVNLRNRIRSYFQKFESLGPKTQALVSNIKLIDIVNVESEIEALLLEAELIKRYKPRYNIELKDDKSPIYIKITTNEQIPRISTVRRENIKGVTYFGPYPSATTAKFVIRMIRKIFPYRSCAQLPKKPCLYYHLKLCDAPCINKISAQEYQKVIKQIILFLKGKKKQLIKQLEREMLQSSKELRFEEAAKNKKKIDAIQYITQTFKKPEEYIENPNLIEDERQKVLEQLADHLRPYIPSFEAPQRIECYDISNFQGSSAVGAMTVATEGAINKKEYRKFKIKTKQSPDDYMMHKEVLQRRLNHSEWPMPDLIVVDGGKGQLSGATQVMRELGMEIPAIGIAKKQEEIIIQAENNFTSLQLPRNDKSLHLLQNLRDEAHRFGITYHRLLRSKSATGNIKSSKAKERMRK